MKVVAGLGLVVSFLLQIALNISKCENTVCLGFQRLFKIVAMPVLCEKEGELRERGDTPRENVSHSFSVLAVWALSTFHFHHQY